MGFGLRPAPQALRCGAAKPMYWLRPALPESPSASTTHVFLRGLRLDSAKRIATLIYEYSSQSGVRKKTLHEVHHDFDIYFHR